MQTRIDSLNKKQQETSSDVFEFDWVKRLLELGRIEALDRDIIVEMIHEIKVFEDRRIRIIYNFSDELDHLFDTDGFFE